MSIQKFKTKDYSLLMLLALPVAFWLSGWRGGLGLVLGWAATAVNLRLMVYPIKKEPKDVAAWQGQILKSILLRYLVIIIALAISGLLKKTALFWAGGAVLVGQMLIVLSLSTMKRRLGDVSHGDQDR